MNNNIYYINYNLWLEYSEDKNIYLVYQENKTSKRIKSIIPDELFLKFHLNSILNHDIGSSTKFNYYNIIESNSKRSEEYLEFTKSDFLFPSKLYYNKKFMIINYEINIRKKSKDDIFISLKSNYGFIDKESSEEKYIKFKTKENDFNILIPEDKIRKYLLNLHD